MLTVGSRDSPFNFSLCWLGPSGPFFPRPLLEHHSSWGAAPPLIITLGLPRRRLRPRMAGAGPDSSSSRWAVPKRPDYPLCDYCHPSSGQAPCRLHGFPRAATFRPSAGKRGAGVCLEHSPLVTDGSLTQSAEPQVKPGARCPWVGPALLAPPKGSALWAEMDSRA